MRRAGTSSIAGSIFAGNTAQAGFGGAVRSAGCPSLAISATTFASNYAKQVGARTSTPSTYGSIYFESSLFCVYLYVLKPTGTRHQRVPGAPGGMSGALACRTEMTDSRHRHLR